MTAPLRYNYKPIIGENQDFSFNKHNIHIKYTLILLFFVKECDKNIMKYIV